VVPLEGQLVTTSDLELTVNGRTALANHHIGGKGVCGGQNGVVLVRGASDTRIGLLASVLRDELESGMASDKLGSGQGDESSGPHFGLI
jgi:hypothetical protein